MGGRAVDDGGVGNVAVHCYGCSASDRVDDERPELGLHEDGWVVSHGETFCPACARQRGLAQADLPATDPPPEAGAPRAALPDVAWQDPGTRREVSRYRGRGLVLIAAGAALLLALGLVLYQKSSHAQALYDRGERTVGVVTGYHVGFRTGCKTVDVSYVAGGSTRVATVAAPSALADLLGGGDICHRGTRLAVAFDGSAPYTLRLPGDLRYQLTFWLEAVLFTGIGLIAAGLLRMASARRWQRRLVGCAPGEDELRYIPADA